MGQTKKIKHFFFGSSEETVKKMLINIKAKYPNTVIAGFYSPPYKQKFSTEENQYFIKLMNDSSADIFWIGLGAPK